MRRGDLYWVAADDDAVPYAHPHLVVQDDVFNRSRLRTVIACALTSNLHKANEPGNVLLEVGEGDLPARSVVVVSQISAIERSRLGARIGALSQARVAQVLAGLRFQQAAYFPPAPTRPTVRDERSGDAAAIRALIRDAFRQAPHSAGDEPDIVDALREAGALTVALVAEWDEALVGHVAVSPVHIEGGTRGWFGLGPIAVAPTHQRRGVGGTLVHAALARLRQRGAAGCVLLGDPTYYGRFGFEPAAPLVLPGAPAAYFQAIDLAGPRPRGIVRYHPAFS